MWPRREARLTARRGSGFMGADLYQRRSAARVTFTPASRSFGPRRRPGAPRRDVLVLFASLALLAAMIFAAIRVTGGGRSAAAGAATKVAAGHVVGPALPPYPMRRPEDEAPTPPS